MPKKLTHEEISKKITSVNTKLSIDFSTYINTHKKCRIVDQELGEFWARPHDIFMKKCLGHPEERKERMKKTNMDRYGVENASSSPEIREKAKDTMVRLYGADNASKVESFKDKRTQTILNLYGVENAWQSEVIKEKICQTNIERYGFASPQQSKDVQEKTAKTNIERYGGRSSMASAEVFRKNQLASAFVTRKTHWKTGEELICRASYEPLVIDYLNTNKINYDWQIRFSLPSGSTYYCDAYLTDSDTYVEIKGYWRADAKIKWAEFISIYPNSEVWDKPKLKKMNILK